MFYITMRAENIHISMDCIIFLEITFIEKYRMTHVDVAVR